MINPPNRNLLLPLAHLFWRITTSGRERHGHRFQSYIAKSKKPKDKKTERLKEEPCWSRGFNVTRMPYLHEGYTCSLCAKFLRRYPWLRILQVPSKLNYNVTNNLMIYRTYNLGFHFGFTRYVNHCYCYHIFIDICLYYFQSI